jgi:hypothetical protein
METEEVEGHLTKLFQRQKCSYGVFACDELQKFQISVYPAAFVINNEISNYTGEHWVALFVPKRNGPVTFFCSFGLGLQTYSHHFEEFVKSHGGSYRQYEKRLQDFKSKVCGHYCIYFLYKLMKGYSLESIYRQFSNNAKLNDFNVSQFVKSYK